MIPGQHDFRIRRGDSELLGAFLHLRDVRTQEIVPADLTGSLITWAIAAPGAALVATSAEGGKLAVDLRYAFVRWPFSPAETAAIPAGSYPYTLKEQASDGRVSTYLIGRLIVSE